METNGNSMEHLRNKWGIDGKKKWERNKWAGITMGLTRISMIKLLVLMTSEMARTYMGPNLTQFNMTPSSRLGPEAPSHGDTAMAQGG